MFGKKYKRRLDRAIAWANYKIEAMSHAWPEETDARMENYHVGFVDGLNAAMGYMKHMPSTPPPPHYIPPPKESRIDQEASVIAVDFDGTLCRHEWPDIGAPNTKLIKDLIRRRRVDGCRVILWTCREGSLLDEAVGWCKAMGLRFDAVNANLPERIAEYGGDCRKVSADLYIDDKNIEMTHQFE